MSPGASVPREPLYDLLIRLRSAVEAQTKALDMDDFESIERVGIDRDLLIAALDQYGPGDLRPEDRVLLEQVAALDQRMVASVRQGLDEADRDLRRIFHGHSALHKYQRRGQELIGSLARLNLEG